MMAHTLTVARKELRALFQSPVALLFLALFLVTNLFLFFSWERFFSRGLADVRPLFDWMPVLLVGLVSAITMRAWAEERRAGTLEILLTLPVPTAALVLGKFVAGMALVGLGLALTLPLPLTVSWLGPLDVGPVIGGYVGALCLAGAYMALGLCVSARTDNQLVALLVTVMLGGALYAIGADAVLALLPQSTADLFAALGTGSRFQSIERGVLDLRDLAYYAGLTVAFLTLNGVFLEAQRLDATSAHGKARARQLGLLSLLVAANAGALVAWLAPVYAARIDLTENREYTLSPATRALIAGLDEPVRVRGLLTQRTHEKLAPLTPQVRDLLAELQVVGGGKVSVEVLDPTEDDTLAGELLDQFGVQSVPFAIADRHSQAVVNAYFHILVEYAGAHEVLSFEDLIDIRFEGSEPVVKLRNLEYDLARAIKKVSQDFQTTDTLLAKLPEGAELVAYITPALLPSEFEGVADHFRSVAANLAERSGGRLAFREVDPVGDAALQDALYTQDGVQPLAVDPFGGDRFYLHLVLRAGDLRQPLYPRSTTTEAEVRQALDAAIQRATPGQLKRVALLTEVPDAPPMDPNIPPQFQPPPPRPDYMALAEVLAERFEVEPIDPAADHIPDAVDVLIVAKPGRLDAAQRTAIDQYLLRGGAVIALAGSHRIDPSQTLRGTPEDRSLAELLKAYGACVGEQLVMADRHAVFPVPVEETVGGFRMRRMELISYPFFPDIRPDAMADHPALAGIMAMTAPWSTTVERCEDTLDDREVVELITAKAGYHSGTDILPDFKRNPPTGFVMPGDREARPLALALTGRFPSAVAEEGNAERLLHRSVADGRLLVVGSSELVSNVMIGVASNSGAEVHRANVDFIQNAIDWAVEDTDLLSIRTAGAFARVLEPMSPEAANAIEGANYAATLGLLGLILGAGAWRRRTRTAMSLEVR